MALPGMVRGAKAKALCLLAFCVLQAAGVHSASKGAKRATEWTPEEWACSPANTKNIYCPKSLQGDSRCTSEFCPAFAGCATEDCHAFQGNIRADKLIALDAYAVKGEKCIRQSFSLAECCSLCKITKGCNAWSYCNNQDGCGTTCDATKHAFSWYSLPQPWNDVDPADHPFRLNPAHACTAAGGFPYGTCSLKVLEPDHLAHPIVQQGNQTGWVSGVLSPGSANAIDPVAFVLEQDGHGGIKQPAGADSFGGLMEEDRTRAPGADPDDVTIPVTKTVTRNAAGVSCSSSWLLLASSCLAAALWAGWSVVM